MTNAGQPERVGAQEPSGFAPGLTLRSVPGLGKRWRSQGFLPAGGQHVSWPPMRRHRAARVRGQRGGNGLGRRPAARARLQPATGPPGERAPRRRTSRPDGASFGFMPGKSPSLVPAYETSGEPRYKRDVRESLRPGLRHELRFRVPESKTVPALYPEASEFQAMPAVFATGFLVGLLEWACLEAIIPHLDWPDEQSVGTHIDVSHEAATPPGFESLRPRMDGSPRSPSAQLNLGHQPTASEQPPVGILVGLIAEAR